MLSNPKEINDAKNELIKLEASFRTLTGEDKRRVLGKLMKKDYVKILKNNNNHMLKPKPLFGGFLIKKYQPRSRSKKQDQKSKDSSSKICSSFNV